MKRYILNGRNIINFHAFLIEFAKALNQKETICTDLFEFDDCLFGYRGLEYPCELIWEEHVISKPFLDHNALIMEYTKLVNAFECSLKNDPDDEYGFSNGSSSITPLPDGGNAVVDKIQGVECKR